ncbi:hypothetical protein HNY73_011290 [Argiope bruennichi]|uniref:DUF4371 domain-containing protein n=1 Tax=Argiope bruennichi TaxID=94029 RepID=A0A8T0F6B0_ARGBR|nr:hypothetical protein HNY73_011290 [Argiope bruennichi]
MGIASGNDGHLLIPILLKQLPHDLVVEFHRRRDPSKIGDVNELIKFIKFESRESANIVTGHSQKVPEIPRYPSRNSAYHGHTKFKNKLLSSAALNTVIKNVCTFCKSDTHTALKCKTFSDKQKRYKLKKDGRCYRCMAYRHLISHCKVKIPPCETCQSLQHNFLFCPKNKSESSSSETETHGQEVVISSVLKAEDNPGSYATLLQMANVQAENGANKIMARLLFDSGSQKSFLSSDLKQALNLKPIRQEKLLIYTFSKKEPIEKIFEVSAASAKTSCISPRGGCVIPGFDVCLSLSPLAQHGHHEIQIIASQEEGVRNAFRWHWIERRDGNGDTIGTWCKKINVAGQAYCVFCNSLLKYGREGFKAFTNHSKTVTHIKYSKCIRHSMTLSNYANSKNTDDLLETDARPLDIVTRKACQEVLITSFIAENSLSVNVAPNLIELCKQLRRDQTALNSLEMSRTAACYKMKYGLAKTIKENIIKTLKETPFSLNLDESTSNAQESILAILVQFYDNNQNEVVVHHFASLKMESCNSEAVFKAVVNTVEDNNIPWANLISVLMDSCNTMYGKKKGY